MFAFYFSKYLVPDLSHRLGHGALGEGKASLLSPTDCAFGVSFFPKGSWRAAFVVPQRKRSLFSCVLELGGICARQGGLLAVTTSPPAGQGLCLVGHSPPPQAPDAVQTQELSSDSSPCWIWPVPLLFLPAVFPTGCWRQGSPAALAQ